MSPDHRRRLGRIGERLALEHLERRGYRLVAANHRTRHGEIDLIVCDADTLVFVEVKARRASMRAGSALDAVPASKQQQVRRMARAWLAEDRDRPRGRELRFDVVGVTLDGRDRLLCLDHVEGAF
jgi:putative endonuclease